MAVFTSFHPAKKGLTADFSPTGQKQAASSSSEAAARPPASKEQK
jgi:hypothetical protein